MGLLKRFFSQTRKPEGMLGALMLRSRNTEELLKNRQRGVQRAAAGIR